jgi:hypothetical protein
VGDLQDTKTQTASDSDLLLPLHVEFPDNEPRKNGKEKVGNNKPG